jgi:hypothetical protein
LAAVLVTVAYARQWSISPLSAYCVEKLADKSGQRNRSAPAVVTFATWQRAVLSQTTDFGQKRTQDTTLFHNFEIIYVDY